MWVTISFQQVDSEGRQVVTFFLGAAPMIVDLTKSFVWIAIYVFAIVMRWVVHSCHSWLSAGQGSTSAQGCCVGFDEGQWNEGPHGFYHKECYKAYT